MNHYDGPAFYRKFVHDGTVNKNKKVNEIKKRKYRYSHGKQNVTDFSRDVQRTDFNNFKPFKTSSSQIDLQNNPIAKITAEFKPRKHYGRPEQGAQKTSVRPTEFQRINYHYRQLTSELTPSDNEVTLLASSADKASNSLQRADSLHFKLADNSSVVNPSDRSGHSSEAFSRLERNDEVAHRSQFDSKEPSSGLKSEEFASANVRSVNSSQNEAAVSSRSSELSSSKAVNSQETSEFSSSEESESSETNIHSEGNSQSSHSMDSNVTINSSDSSEESESSAPLGHNISSIMHDEGQDIKNNLELFKRSNSSSVPKNVGRKNKINSNESDSSDEIDSSPKPDDSESSISKGTSKGDPSFGQRPNFVAQNPTNVQPSSDFDDSDSDDEEHHEIQPSTVTNYQFPDHDLLVAPKHYDDQGLDDWILNKAEILNKTLRAFHVNAQVVDWTNGPTVTQFQVKLHLGVKVSKINHLSDDLKMALAAKDIRIQAPIPGKTTCGIEIPNPKPRPVMLSEVVNSKTFRNSKSDLTIALGVDLTGKPRVTDLRKMPHGLIAGATGSGKSVFINCMLVSLMYKATPQELKMILIDPKAVEFAPYNGIPYLLSPVISEPKQAAASLKWATKEMNQRYDKLAAAGVRNIEQFNQKAEQHHRPDMKMPYILIVIDELADLMMVAGDEIETYIVRITQKARAAGIHLVVATQRPSVDVITGTMKNNIPTRVAFMVSSQVDSRTIIDQSGAERLLGKGDMLFLGNGSSHPIRLQGCFVSNGEIDKVAGFARHQEPAHYAFHPGSLLKHVSQIENQDKLMPQVLAYIAKEKTVSTSKLQRVFSIGYNRSAKIIDDLEKHGYISGQEGSKPRDVYLTEKDYKKLNL